jgi:hypothetical protein
MPGSELGTEVTIEVLTEVGAELRGTEVEIEVAADVDTEDDADVGTEVAIEVGTDDADLGTELRGVERGTDTADTVERRLRPFEASFDASLEVAGSARMAPMARAARTTAEACFNLTGDSRRECASLLFS